MIDYLQTPPNFQQSQQQYLKSLHETLVQRYYDQCHGKWYLCRDDGYFYQFFCFHAIAAEADQILEEYIMDFNLINAKLKTFQSFNKVYEDIKSYLEYLQAKGKVGYKNVY